MSTPVLGVPEIAPTNPYASDEAAITHWLEAMSGMGGDVLRQSLINPVLVQLIEKLKLQKGENAPDFCRVPMEVFYSGLMKVRDQLYHDANVIDDSRNQFVRGPIVELNRAWCTSANGENLEPAKIGILDVGCGEGFAARLLHRHVESYLGYDASPQLIAKAHNRFTTEVLSVASKAYYSDGDREIEFSGNRNDKFSFVHRPWPPVTEELQAVADEIDRGLGSIDVILLLSLLDHLADPPDRFLVGLRDIIKKLDIKRVPIVATTLDPAFFAVGAHLADGGGGFKSSDVPFRTWINLTNATIGQGVTGKMEIRLRAPQDWERIFRRSGYHVLQQVRIHLNVLPPKIALHFSSLAIAQGCGAPRCAPVVFWILTPRTEARTAERVVVNRRPFEIETVQISKGERLEIVGNLGQHVYFVRSGELTLKTHGYFSTPDGSKGRERKIRFLGGDVIGELEAIGDPVFSRHIGSVDCLEDAELIAVSIDEFKYFWAHQLSRGLSTDGGGAGNLSKVQSALANILNGLARKTAVLVFEYEIDSVHGSGEAKSALKKRGQAGDVFDYSRTFTSNLCAALFAKRAERAGKDSFFNSVEIEDLTELGQMLHNNTGRAPTRAWRDSDVLAFCLLQDLGIVDSTPSYPAYRTNLRASRRVNIYDVWAAIGVLLADNTIFDIESAARFSGACMFYSTGSGLQGYAHERNLLGSFGSLYEKTFGKANRDLKYSLDDKFGIVSRQITPAC